MSGLNSLSGLSNVSVDFRPTITTNAPNTGNVTQPLLPEAEIAPENAPQPEMAEAKSVVRQLDEKDDYKVTVKGIDNDASFNSRQVGLRKYSLNKLMANMFEEELKETCSKVLGRGWKSEYENRIANDPARG